MHHSKLAVSCGMWILGKYVLCGGRTRVTPGPAAGGTVSTLLIGLSEH